MKYNNSNKSSQLESVASIVVDFQATMATVSHICAENWLFGYRTISTVFFFSLCFRRTDNRRCVFFVSSSSSFFSFSLVYVRAFCHYLFHRIRPKITYLHRRRFESQQMKATTSTEANERDDGMKKKNNNCQRNRIDATVFSVNTRDTLHFTKRLCSRHSLHRRRLFVATGPKTKSCAIAKCISIVLIDLSKTSTLAASKAVKQFFHFC